MPRFGDFCMFTGCSPTTTVHVLYNDLRRQNNDPSRCKYKKKTIKNKRKRYMKCSGFLGFF